jgi:hypothetical protein
MTQPWMLDELAHAGPDHLDPDFVAGYEAKQGYPDPKEDVEILAAHGLDGRSTVVDLGAGTRCSAPPASRSPRRTSPARCTAPTPAARAERAGSALDEPADVGRGSTASGG